MNFFVVQRALALAVKNLVSARGRSLLSMATILFGAVAVVATFTINQNVDTYIEALIRRSGGPVLRLSLPNRPGMQFEEKDIRLLESIKSIVNVQPDLNTSSYSVRFDGKVFNPSVIAVGPEGISAGSLKVIEGRLFDLDEFETDTRAVVISAPTAQSLGLDEPVGQIVPLFFGSGEILVRIVGVVKSEQKGEFDFGSLWMTDRLFYKISGSQALKKVVVTAREAELLNPIEKTVKSLFEGRFGRDLRVYNVYQEHIRTRDEMKSLVYAGLVLGTLALVAGSVGIMNVMLVSVRLRRREVGLYRALGFASWIIWLQFFLESCLLSIIGAILGSTAGSWLGVKVSAFLVSPFERISPTAIALGLGVTILLGAVLGISPAIRAAKMDPVEALRG